MRVEKSADTPKCMKISILTVGSRGDVQPYVALGQGLQAAGHRVTLATHADWEPFVAEHGLAFRPVAGDLRGTLEGEAGQMWLGERPQPAPLHARADRHRRAAASGRRRTTTGRPARTPI